MTETVTGEQPAIADQTPVETEVTADAAPAVTDADEATTGKPPVQKRIDELTRLRREAERDRDYWREHATRQQPQPKAEPVVSNAPKPLPKLEDFEYDESRYAAALIAHATEEASRKVREGLKQEEADRQKAERVKSWKTRESEFQASHDDYIDKAHYAPMSESMVEIIQESEHGPELAYYLGNNREIAERIAGLSPARAAYELGRIEAKFEAPPAAAPPPKQVSKAPPPPPKIEGTDPTPRISTTDPDSDKLSDDEWVKAEQARLKRRANRK